MLRLRGPVDPQAGSKVGKGAWRPENQTGEVTDAKAALDILSRHMDVARALRQRQTGGVRTARIAERIRRDQRQHRRQLLAEAKQQVVNHPGAEGGVIGGKAVVAGLEKHEAEAPTFVG